jgi:hypothetical protein
MVLVDLWAKAALVGIVGRCPCTEAFGPLLPAWGAPKLSAASLSPGACGSGASVPLSSLWLLLQRNTVGISNVCKRLQDLGGGEGIFSICIIFWEVCMSWKVIESFLCVKGKTGTGVPRASVMWLCYRPEAYLGQSRFAGLEIFEETRYLSYGYKVHDIMEM